MNLSDKTVGFAMCGSFCTFSQVIPVIAELVHEGAKIVPIMSHVAYTTDTRFGTAREHIEKVEEICGKKIIHTICDAEPIGPGKLLDLMIVAPCTGNTVGKLANGIYDGPVTLAVKAHLRNERPVLLAVATNDALAASAGNIGRLMNTRNYHFVPLYRDDPLNKPDSLVADFSKIKESALKALE